MLISKAEMESLRVISVYKDAPAEILNTERYMLNTLLDLGYLKLNRAKTSLRLTKAGAEVLLSAGIPAEIETRSAGYMRMLERRMQSTQVALFFNSMDINVFSEDIPREILELRYLPTSVLRGNNYSNVLGMSKFIGLLYTVEFTYAVYNISNPTETFYPQTDEDIFTREIISANTPVKILYVSGRNLDEMAEGIVKQSPTEKRICGFEQAIERFNSPVCLVSMNDTGCNQLRIMLTEDYKEKLARDMLEEDYCYVNADFLDASFNGKYLIVFIDFDVKRLETALKIVNNLHILVLKEQLPALRVLLNNRKAVIYAIEAEKSFEVLGIPKPQDRSTEQYKTKEGGGVVVKTIPKTNKRKSQV